LLIDDEKVFLQWMKKRLEIRGLGVTAVGNGMANRQADERQLEFPGDDN